MKRKKVINFYSGSLRLRKGEVLCTCEGTGRKREIYKETVSWEGPCPKCHGYGKLLWIDKMMGGKKYDDKWIYG